MLKKNETKGKHLLNEVRDKEDPLYTPLTDFISLLAACQQQYYLWRPANVPVMQNLWKILKEKTNLVPIYCI